MMKKTKRYEDGGYLLDSEGKRVKSGSGDDIRSGSYDKEADMESARNKLAGEVQEMVKAKSDSDRVSKDAEESSKAPASSAKMPTRPGQGAAKSKPAVVTKEQLAKSGLTLREYMNKQQGKTARSGAPAKSQSKSSTPAVSSSYRSEGANKAKPAAPSGNVASTAPAKKSGSSLSALPMNPSLLRQRDEDEKKRDAARAARRASDEAEKKARPAKEAAERKMLSEQPGAVAYRKKREEEDKMSPGQRSAARGKAVKEFFGMAKGGAVRGAGIAKQGVRKCKMV
jgi:hypothetical protein